MASPLIPIALNVGGQVLGNVAKKWFTGKTEFNMTNPADYKDDLMMSDQDISRSRQRFTDSLNPYVAKSQADIKQVGAAGRLPEGATQGALSGILPKIAKSTGDFETRLLERKKMDMARYLEMQQRYDAAKMAHEGGNANAMAAFNQQGMGNLSKLAMMWSAGLFNQGNTPQPQGGMQ